MNMKKTFSCYEISKTVYFVVRDIVQFGLESDTILHFFKVHVLLPIYQ